MSLNNSLNYPVFFSALIGVLFSVLLSGCSKQEPLVIGTHPWVGYQPPMLNSDQDLPKNIIYNHGSSALQTMQGLRDRTLDAGYLTLDESLILISEGVPLKIVLVADSSAGADQVVSRETNLNASKIKQLTIGYEQSALGELMLWHFLQKYQLSKEQVSIKNITMGQQSEAYKNGQIDIAINYPPFTRGVTKHGAKRVFDSSEMPNTIVDVLVVHKSAFNGKRKLIHLAVAQHLKGVKYLKQNYNDAIYQMAENLKTSSQDIRDTLNGINLPSRTVNYNLLKKDGEIEKLTHKLINMMQQAGIIKSTPPPSRWVTHEYIP